MESNMEQEIKVEKYGATMSISHEQVAGVKRDFWHMQGAVWDKRYKRKVLSKTWIPVNEETLTKFKELEIRLVEVEDELYELGAERENGGYWEAPEGRYEIEYAETDEEWVERCKQLDTDAK